MSRPDLRAAVAAAIAEGARWLLAAIGAAMGAPAPACTSRSDALCRAAAAVSARGGGQHGWVYTDAVQVGNRWMCVIEDGDSVYLVEVAVHSGVARVLTEVRKEVSVEGGTARSAPPPTVPRVAARPGSGWADRHARQGPGRPGDALPSGVRSPPRGRRGGRRRPAEPRPPSGACRSGPSTSTGRRVVPSTGVLREVFDRRLRWCAAMLCLCGTGLAAVSVVPAFRRLGTGQGLAFVAVAVLSAALAVAVLRARRWALALSAVGLGGQALAVVGTIAELVAGIDAGKARQVRLLGFDPVTAVTVNLVYSAVGFALFCWLAARWLRWRSTSAG